jgi:hypothetical protein
MQVMHTQAFQDLKLCDSQIHVLESNAKVKEEKESNLKLKLQGLLISREDESEKELLDNQMANSRTLMVNESNKLNDAQFDRMVEFKNEQRYAKRF